jgi:3'-5' exoribonuclease
VQLAEKIRKTLADGKPFFTCRFRDATRTVGAVPIWSDSPHFEMFQQWSAGEFFKIRATYSEHEKYGPQLDIEQIRPVEERDRAEGFDPLDFAERSRLNTDEMFADLQALVTTELSDLPLRSLVLKLLTAHEPVLKALPGSARHYYPYPGGWLEHTLAVARSCVWLAASYASRFPELNPPLNRGLVLAAAVLHDIGRVRELDARPGLPIKDTVAGELFGRSFLGYDTIRAAAAETPDLDPELLDLLLHCVVAHLKNPEWGSTRQPCIPEALILQHAADLDARMEMYVRCLMRDTADGPFTDRDPIFGRPLLKSRKV